MNVKFIESMLYKYPVLLDYIKQIKQEIKDDHELRTQVLGGIKATMLTGMPHGTEVGNPTLQAVQELIDKYDQRILEKTKKLNEWENEKENIEVIIDGLTNIEREIIKLRYFEHRHWEYITYNIHYSWSQCKRVRNNALEKINVNYEKRAIMSHSHVI